MEAQRLKLIDLQNGHRYYVVGYRLINSEFGGIYLITCTSPGSDKEFEMFAPKLVASYISEYSPTNKFLFTNRIIYSPNIHRATKTYNLTMLSSSDAKHIKIEVI